MEIEIFALCEAATETVGKLNLLGAFDTLLVQALPAVHPFCAIAVRMRFRRIEAGSHHVVIHLVNEDGQLVIPPMQGDINITVQPAQPSAVANIILTLQQIKFEALGEYAVNLAIDGRQVGSLPLYVRQR
jgi:hypothetical protein